MAVRQSVTVLSTEQWMHAFVIRKSIAFRFRAARWPACAVVLCTEWHTLGGFENRFIFSRIIAVVNARSLEANTLYHFFFAVWQNVMSVKYIFSYTKNPFWAIPFERPNAFIFSLMHSKYHTILLYIRL